MAQPPGKRLQNVMLLSGGEKALTAISLLFAIFQYKPSPFCILDEVDAPLDDANIGRFVRMLEGLKEQTQFVLITHSPQDHGDRRPALRRDHGGAGGQQAGERPVQLTRRKSTPGAALERLREGNRRFALRTSGPGTAIASHARRNELAAGQEPFAIILGCSDSRVPAEIVFDQGLGDLFVIRVAGNIVAPSQVGSVEFAAERFGTRLVVVLGHSQCGAILATLEELQQPTDQPVAEPALDRRPRPAVGRAAAGDRARHDPEALVRQAVRANIRASANHLRHGSEILEQLIQNDGLLVVGAEYSLETGVVDFFDGSGEVGPCPSASSVSAARAPAAKACVRHRAPSPARGEEGRLRPRDFYDVWLPELAPSAPSSPRRSRPWTPARWRRFARRTSARCGSPRRVASSPPWPRSRTRRISRSAATARTRRRATAACCGGCSRTPGRR